MLLQLMLAPVGVEEGEDEESGWRNSRNLSA
jgi:hypothetical protein